MSFTSWGNNASSTSRPKKLGFESWSFDKPAQEMQTESDSGSSGFDSWGSNDTSSYDEDWSTDSWRHEFPDHSGTKNPQSDPEKVRRKEYLENELYYLRDHVKNGQEKVDNAICRRDELQRTLEETRNSFYEANEGYLRTGREKAGLEGKQIGNHERIAELRDRLTYTTDTWTINEIRSELERRQGARETIANDISTKTDSYWTFRDRKNELETRVGELERKLETATDNIETYREEYRLKKAKLDEYNNELANLDNPW